MSSDGYAAPPPPAPEPPLVAELVNRGVTKVAAADLVQRHPAETIRAEIDVFDWKTGEKRLYFVARPKRAG